MTPATIQCKSISKRLTRLAQVAGRPALTLSRMAANSLLNHDWLGNVREMDNVMQRATILQTEAISSAVNEV